MADMLGDPTQDKALRRFRDEVAVAYGDRLERIVLFGSRARGDAREDSDYDVAVFLHGLGGAWSETEPLRRIGDDILWQTGAVINALAFPAGGYEERTMLMHEIRREGRVL